MKRVSVVGTVHAEKGRANTSALLAILERIRPEVIFLEIPAAADDDFNDNPKDLESTAVARYRKNHRVDLIPVDLPTRNAEFIGYAVSTKLPTQGFTLSCTRIHGGQRTERWLYI